MATEPGETSGGDWTILVILAACAVVVPLLVWGLRRLLLPLTRRRQAEIEALLQARDGFDPVETYAVFSRGFSLDPARRQIAIVNLPDVEIVGADRLLGVECWMQTGRLLPVRSGRFARHPLDVTTWSRANNVFLTFWIGDPNAPRPVSFDMGRQSVADPWLKRLAQVFPEAVA